MRQLSKLTYSDLVNHEMKYPGHPKFLHRLFSPFVIGSILFFLFVLLGLLLGANIMVTIIASLIGTFYVQLKVFIATNSLNGHGVGVVKVKKRVLGLPPKVFLWMLLPLFGSAVLVYIAFFKTGNLSGFAVTQANIKIFSLALFIGTLMTFFVWRFHTYYLTWYGDSYDALKEFKDKGFSDEKIKIMMARLYKQGILYKHADD